MSFFTTRVLSLFILILPAFAQVFTNSSLTQTGDPGSAVYNTSGTLSNATAGVPDVFLNASVSVGEIDLLVANLSVKINIDAQVLNLLQFNAGVTAQIDRVQLTIQNITAFAQLEARLGNIVLMINDVLNSLDLNPILATLGQDVGNLINTTVGGLTGGNGASTGTLTARSSSPLGDFVLIDNVLYSINNYEGNTHTNRILAHNGDIVDESLDNDGHVTGQTVVGNYATSMTPNGYDKPVTINGVTYRETEYDYTPIPGLSIVAAIFQDTSGTVVAARVLAEARGGGYSTIE
jgi:hypothetical protein